MPHSQFTLTTICHSLTYVFLKKNSTEVSLESELAERKNCTYDLRKVQKDFVKFPLTAL